MVEAGFLEQKRTGPMSFGVVLAIHAGVIGALMLAKMDVIPLQKDPPLRVTPIELVKPKPPEPVDMPEPRPAPAPPTFAEPIVDIDVPVDTIRVDPTPTNVTFVEPLPVKDAVPDPTPPLPPRIEQSAKAKGDVRSLISADDYPDVARRRGETGSLKARLEVSASGKVSGCSIISSSGSSSLDTATCRILKARARFTPAKDSQGRPTTDSYVTPTIIWKLS